jgi:hypothetical protein
MVAKLADAQRTTHAEKDEWQTERVCTSSPPFRAGEKVRDIRTGQEGVVEAYNQMRPAGWIYRVVFGNSVKLYHPEGLSRLG